MPEFDSCPAFRPGLRLWLSGPFRFPVGPAARQVSRFSRVQFLDVLLALGLRRAQPGLAFSTSLVLPSRWEHTVGARFLLFGAQFPARRCLYLRFTRTLAGAGARLEVKMVRYSFLVGLFHPLLHAGLSRRLRSLWSRLCGRLDGVECGNERDLGASTADSQDARRRRRKAMVLPQSSRPAIARAPAAGSGTTDVIVA
jgi:hypothetical protein